MEERVNRRNQLLTDLDNSKVNENRPSESATNVSDVELPRCSSGDSSSEAEGEGANQGYESSPLESSDSDQRSRKSFLWMCSTSSKVATEGKNDDEDPPVESISRGSGSKTPFLGLSTSSTSATKLRENEGYESSPLESPTPPRRLSTPYLGIRLSSDSDSVEVLDNQECPQSSSSESSVEIEKCVVEASTQFVDPSGYNPALEPTRFQYDQLFIRGANIVLVRILSTEISNQ